MFSGIKRIGVDESGKGDYFGYLVAVAVLVDKNSEKKLRELRVRDSKKLLDSAALALAAKIRKICVHEIIRISPEKYNALYAKFRNLNKLLAWAHARAIENVLEKEEKMLKGSGEPCAVAISDKFGDERFLEKALFGRGKKIKLVQAVRAESDTAVAAASILARAEFLRTLKRLSMEIGYKLPKGATHVEDAAKEIVGMHGKEALPMVAKMHFKITKKILKEKD